jgi:hypothetical protein
MKIDKQKLRSEIEDCIALGVINGEEVDVTTDHVMNVIQELITAVEDK